MHNLATGRLPNPGRGCADWPLRIAQHPATSPPTDDPLKRGEVAEWSNAAVSKTVVGLRRPRVRIPVSPPFHPFKILKLNAISKPPPPQKNPPYAGWVLPEFQGTGATGKNLTVRMLTCDNTRQLPWVPLPRLRPEHESRIRFRRAFRGLRSKRNGSQVGCLGTGGKRAFSCPTIDGLWDDHGRSRRCAPALSCRSRRFFKVMVPGPFPFASCPLIFLGAPLLRPNGHGQAAEPFFVAVYDRNGGQAVPWAVAAKTARPPLWDSAKPQVDGSRRPAPMPRGKKPPPFDSVNCGPACAGYGRPCRNGWPIAALAFGALRIAFGPNCTTSRNATS